MSQRRSRASARWKTILASTARSRVTPILIFYLFLFLHLPAFKKVPPGYTGFSSLYRDVHTFFSFFLRWTPICRGNPSIVIRRWINPIRLDCLANYFCVIAMLGPLPSIIQYNLLSFSHVVSLLRLGMYPYLFRLLRRDRIFAIYSRDSHYIYPINLVMHLPCK